MASILIHIGYGKAGSKYLQRWFHSHPHLYFQPKEYALGFFHAWEMTRYAEHAAHAPENYVLSWEGISLWQGEVHALGIQGSVPYNHRSYQNNICNMLHDLYPTAKILIITRGYAGIFKSIYAQYVGMSGILTFREMIAINPGMLETLLDYSSVIQLYREKFGHDNVIVLPYELLRDDAPRFLSLIERAMNIKEKFEYSTGKVNPSLDAKTLYIYHRASLLVYNLLKPLPLRLRVNLYKRYTKLVKSRKLNGLFARISKIVNKPVSLEGLEETVASMKGKADILSREPLYQPYLKDYLL